MGIALGFAAWLAIFADKTPQRAISARTQTATGKATGMVQHGPTPVVATAAPAGAPYKQNVPERQEPAAASKTAPAADKEVATPLLVLVPREELIGGVHASKNGVGLFNPHDWTPPPPVVKPPPPPPPTAPPLPFTFIGKKFEDGNWEIYLARGEQTYIVHTDTMLDGSYRVSAIAPPTLTLIYLPLQQPQTLNIGDAE